MNMRALLVSALDEAIPTGKQELVSMPGGTSTGNMPFDKLIAPSTPDGRRGKKKDEDDAVLGVVRRASPTDHVCTNESCKCQCNGGSGDCTCGPECPCPCTHVHRGESYEIAGGALPDNLLRVPAIKQTSGFCGPAALLSVLSFYGVSTTEQEVAKAAGATHESGISIDGLIKAAESFGMVAEYRQNGDSAAVTRYVKQDRTPLIVLWYGHGRLGDGGHVSVVVGADGSNVYLMDPEPGMVVPKLWEKFLTSWFSFVNGVPGKDDLRIGEHLIVRPW